MSGMLGRDVKRDGNVLPFFFFKYPFKKQNTPQKWIPWRFFLVPKNYIQTKKGVGVYSLSLEDGLLVDSDGWEIDDWYM